ncbi:MAG TPA: class I SAM-dependent methyltransferase [Chloroflexia bacterium]|nr:class I SAM-dependent methyltransferase [Chloroflexia bacterium]
MNPNSDLKQYYADRAQEYERVYALPERQDDLRALRGLLQELLAGHDVLEVACGTGYWTQPVSETARSILATDVNSEVLDLARKKLYPAGKVRFQLADAFTLEGVSGDFTAGFAAFWWSHIKRSELRGFLKEFHAKLGPGRLVVFADNSLRGTRHPFTRHDAEGNTFQTRRLEDGREYEVLKNIPTEAELRDCLDGIAADIAFISLTYYWCLTYQTA